VKIRLPHVALCVATVAALAAAGCDGSGGSDGKKLPRSVSQELLTHIEQVESRVEANVSGACDDIFDGVAGGNFDEIAGTLSSIPDNVDPDIRSAVSESVDRLQDLVNSKCDEIQAREQDRQETVPEETTTDERTTPTETETTPTETETTPTETETTPTTPDPPPNGNGPDGTGPPGQDDGGGVEAPDGL
jgi:hypothetical protein